MAENPCQPRESNIQKKRKHEASSRYTSGLHIFRTKYYEEYKDEFKNKTLSQVIKEAYRRLMSFADKQHSRFMSFAYELLLPINKQMLKDTPNNGSQPIQIHNELSSSGIVSDTAKDTDDATSSSIQVESEGDDVVSEQAQQHGPIQSVQEHTMIEALDTTTAKVPKIKPKNVGWAEDVLDAEMEKLYTHCIEKMTTRKTLSKIVIQIYNYHLDYSDTRTWGPCQWLGSMVMILVSKVWTRDQIDNLGIVKRYYAEPLIVEKLMSQDPSRIDYKEVLELIGSTYRIIDCDFVFAPVLFNQQWFCLAIVTANKTMYVLDSLVDDHDSSRRECVRIMGERFSQLFNIIEHRSKQKWNLRIENGNMPQQHNTRILCATGAKYFGS